MYRLNSPAVYVHSSVLDSPVYRERMQRVVDALETPVQPRAFSDSDVPALLRELGQLRVPMGAQSDVPDPVLVFNTFRFDGRRAEAHKKVLDAEQSDGNGHGRLLDALTGYGAFHYAGYNQPGDPHGKEKVCRPCWRLHFQNGCVHKCHYCGLGGVLATMVNVEDYLRQLDRVIEAHPWQETFLLEDDAEIPVLEPELGCLGPMIEHFGRLDGRYLVIHTKSWNTDWMRDLDHRGNTIIVWSLAGPDQAENMEPVTGTSEQRIEAARRCQDAGYTVRFKFKPIIPVRGWREQASQTVRRMFERTKPDVISLCVFMWMGVDEMKHRLDPAALDPEFLTAAEEAKERMGEVRTRPFPPEVRAEIYRHYLREIRRHDPDVPVSLSTESFEMWSELSDELGATATNYVCGCGPNSTPGCGQLEIHPFRTPVKSGNVDFEAL